MVERPLSSFVLLLVAGALILFFGILVSYRAHTPETTSVMLLDALLCGIAVLTAGTLLYALPKYHVIFGVLVITFSVFSIFSAGGLFTGMVLGIIGGASGADWKSAYPPTSLRYIHF